MPFLGVYGHVNVDHILLVKELPKADQTVPVQQDLVRLGGTAGNIARAAASLGVDTALAGCVGDDFPPDFRKQLETSGIDLTDLRHVPGLTPKIWILSLPDGGQSAVIDQGVMGDDVKRPQLDYTMLGSTWTHFSTGAPADHLRVAREASRIGKKVAFDPAQEISYRYPPRLLEQFLDVSDLFFCNEAELGRAVKAFGYGEATQLLDHVDAIVETRGAKGTRLHEDGEILETPACPIRSDIPKHAVGAGDSFRAGVYAALKDGRTLEESVRWGAVGASLFLEARGERFPTREALLGRLADWKPS